ncbi:pentapeptide repeat-containing protein [Aerosakkonema sp. BLCC-F183]
MQALRQTCIRFSLQDTSLRLANWDGANLSQTNLSGADRK